MKTNFTAEAASPPTHRVRVSLEGNHLGKPLRFAEEFEVPSNGQWQPRRIVLEADQIPSDQMDTLRLTIDSLSTGRLWVDDIHLHDDFATQAERSALGGKVFLAIQGLQQNRPGAAADLLNNPWSLYLLSQTDAWRENVPPQHAVSNPAPADAPPAGARQARMEQSSRSGADANGSQRGESVADRIREWLPRPLRF